MRGFARAFDRMNFAVRLCAGLLLVLLAGCQQEQRPLKVGFVGGLTGRAAGLGVAGRDGVLMAVEEFNRSGGIKGRQVELLTRDDQQDAETASQAVKELIAADAVAIIGPMTSAMAVAMQPIVNREQIVMISPTVTSNQFNDQDDWLFRTTTPLRINAEKLAAYVARQGIRTIAVSVDMTNAAYTEDWLASFRKPFEAGGGRIVHVERFSSGAEGGYLPLAERLLQAKPAALLLLSSAMDSALVAQQVRKLGSPLPLFASEWANTSDVVSFGGKAVEEMRSFVTYNPGSQAPRHRAFLDDFEKRFGYEPSFAAVLGYEAASCLFAGLTRNPQRDGLKEALLRAGAFPGLHGEVRINRFGDAERDTFLAVIRNGQFVTIE